MNTTIYHHSNITATQIKTTLELYPITDCKALRPHG